MANIVTVKDTFFDNVQRRLIKFLRMGRSDVRTSPEASPFGIDSNPIAGMKAVYMETSTDGQSVIIGYVKQSQLAQVGETRLYSVDANGETQFYVWLKNDGTLQLGGTNKHLARFEELKDGFDELRGDLNSLVSAFNAHMHATAGTGPPSPPTPGAGIPATASTASIDSSKIDEITTL